MNVKKTNNFRKNEKIAKSPLGNYVLLHVFERINTKTNTKVNENVVIPRKQWLCDEEIYEDKKKHEDNFTIFFTIIRKKKKKNE